MPPEPDAIFALALACKDAVVDGYAAEGVELPARQLVTPGRPAFDCEMLAVQAEGGFGIAGSVTDQQMLAQAARAGHVMRAVRVGVTLLRCVPMPDDEGNPPSAEAEEAAAEVIYADVVLVLNSLIAAERAGSLPGCHGVAFEDWVSVGPEGGLAGSTTRLRLRVGM